jgi:AAA-like domain
MLHNPYVNTNTVRDQNMFFGRHALLRRIYGELISKECISLIGLQHIGKSSLLHALSLREMQGNFADLLQQHIFVPLDLREYSRKSSDDFFDDVSKCILAQARKHLKLDHEPEEGPDEFKMLLSEIQEQGFHTVLLMDAFDNVARNNRFNWEFFSFLRSQATFGRVSYVTATTAPLQKVCHRDIQDSPFFNIFAKHEVGAFDLEEARELVLRPSQNAGLSFTSDEVDWIIKLAGRHPFFLQQVCNSFFEEKLLHQDAKVDRKQVKNQVYHELEPHFNGTWERLSLKEQEQLKDEARMVNKQTRDLPQLSESSLFRLFVRNKFKIYLFRMTVETLEEALDRLDDPNKLGECELANIVSSRGQQGTLVVVEKGLLVRKMLNEAFERMHGTGVRQDSASDWRLYNILYYRYFKHHLKNDQISTRLQFTSTRQYFRERTKAIDALFTILLEMEHANLTREEE